MKNYNNYNQKSRNYKPWIIGGLVVVFLGFIFWWGMHQKPNAVNSASASPGVGEMAPAFDLPSANGGDIKLSDYLGKQDVLIYFHEGMSCDPCMQQMPDLEKYRQQFLDMNVAPLYIALDNPDQMKTAIEKYNLQTPVLSYQNARTEVDYNLTKYSMGMGRRAGHTFVLIGTDGKIIWRKDYWPNYGMDVPGGLMFVNGSDIMTAVKQALGKS